MKNNNVYSDLFTKDHTWDEMLAIVILLSSAAKAAATAPPKSTLHPITIPIIQFTGYGTDHLLDNCYFTITDILLGKLYRYVFVIVCRTTTVTRRRRLRKGEEDEELNHPIYKNLTIY